MAVQDGDILQSVVSYSFPESSVMQNVFHWLVEATAPVAETLVMNAMADVMELFYGYLDSLINTDGSIPELVVDQLEFNGSSNQWETFRRIGDDTLGLIVFGSTGGLLPAGVSALAQFIPIYRKHSGYKYVGGFTEADNDLDGDPSAGLITALLTAAGSIIATDFDIDPGVATMSYVILNRGYELYNTPTSASVRARWAYQRRRKENVGL